MRTQFEQWIAAFRPKAMAHGITAETYTHVMSALEPDTAGLEAIRQQAEFNELLWRCAISSARPASSRPTAIPASSSSTARVRARDPVRSRRQRQRTRSEERRQ